MAETKGYEQKPRVMKPMRGRGMPVPKGSIKKGTFKRLLKTVFKYYKWKIFVVLLAILVTSVGSLVSSVYMQLLVDEVITPALKVGFNEELRKTLVGLIILMVAVYSLVVITSFVYTRVMATITQGVLYRLRTDMFAKMQKIGTLTPKKLRLWGLARADIWQLQFLHYGITIRFSPKMK